MSRRKGGGSRKLYTQREWEECGYDERDYCRPQPSLAKLIWTQYKVQVLQLLAVSTSST